MSYGRRTGGPGPTEVVDLTSGLTLNPRLKLILTFFRSDLSLKPVDEWQLKRALLGFLGDSLALAVPEDDLIVRKRPDLQKRKREEPVANGAVYVRDLEFLRKKSYSDGEGEKDGEVVRKRFAEWKEDVIRKTDGIELNLEGVKFRLVVEAPLADDFDGLKKSWEEFYAWKPSGNRYSTGSARRPDTIVVKGIPSRWFAEPRVSSKPSMLVTHTIFSVLGKIRNINVVADGDQCEIACKEGKSDIVSGLHCKIWVQFDDHGSFCFALHALCGHSLQKQGSRLKADYEVTWDRDGYFRNVSHRVDKNQQERVGNVQASLRHSKMETSRLQSGITRSDYNGFRPKRFRE